MKKLIAPALFFSFVNVSHSYATESCEDFFLLNLAPSSKCETKSNKTLFKEKDSITVMQDASTGLKWHKPSKNEALTLKEARKYCADQGYRLPNVDELKDFVNDTYSARLGGITSCRSLNRSFFSAEASVDPSSLNIVPVEGQASWSQRSFEIAAFDLSSNEFVLRYEAQKFNAMCVEDVDRSPSFQAVSQHSCSEYWLASPSISVGTTCKFDDSLDLTKTSSGFEYSDGAFFTSPSRNDNVSNFADAKDHCDAQGLSLMSKKGLDYLFDGITDLNTNRKPQVFCVGEFAGSESALIEDGASQKPLEWYFPINSLRKNPTNLVGFRIVCES